MTCLLNIAVVALVFGGLAQYGIHTGHVARFVLCVCTNKWHKTRSRTGGRHVPRAVSQHCPVVWLMVCALQCVWCVLCCSFPSLVRLAPYVARRLVDHVQHGGEAPPKPDIPPIVREWYTPRPSDVIISPPAKSGTTWLLHMAHQLRMKGADPTYDDQVRRHVVGAGSCR